MCVYIHMYAHLNENFNQQLANNTTAVCFFFISLISFITNKSKNDRKMNQQPVTQNKENNNRKLCINREIA